MNWLVWLKPMLMNAHLPMIVPIVGEWVSRKIWRRMPHSKRFLTLLPLIHKMCLCLERFGVGQNLYIYKQTQESAATDWTRAITDWYDEVKLFSKNSVKPFKYVSEIVGD